MRYGIFGGTFDPFHSGHLSMITGAIESGKVDRVLVIPSGYPPKKDAHLLTPAVYRFYMTRAALRNVANCSVLPIEIERPRISYTVHTLEALEEEEIIKNDDEIYLLYGTDILFEITSWYHPEMILKKAKLLIATRPGIPQRDTLTKINELEEKYSVEILFYPITGVDVSSREIRASHTYQKLSEPVRQFIRKNNLYSDDNPLRHLADDTHRQLFFFSSSLFGSLSEKRHLHSMNTALLAASYAASFGANPDEAVIAGILHDCAKELPIALQYELAARSRSPETNPDHSIIHAPAGEVYAREHFGIENPNILSAIRYHTTGRADMTMLEKIIFLADKLEPGRDYADLAPIRHLATYDLDAAVLMCLQAVAESVSRKKMPVHPDAEQAIVKLTSEKQKKNRPYLLAQKKEENMDLQKVSEKIVSILDDKKAKDIELLPVADKTALAEYFVIASGTSVTHIKALAEEVEFVLKNEIGLTPDHIEGLSTGRWVLLDYKDIIVHIFHPEERSHYSLEKLWLTKRPDSVAPETEE